MSNKGKVRVKCKHCGKLGYVTRMEMSCIFDICAHWLCLKCDEKELIRHNSQQCNNHSSEEQNA